MEKRDLAALWRQIVEDYREIRREQEEMWHSLTPEERIYLTEQLLLLLQEAERVRERQKYVRRDPPTPETTGGVP